MYVGMTKLSLQERLKEHLSNSNSRNRKNVWKNERDKQISIHLIQDNIKSFEYCSEIELFWARFWKSINPELKNSIFYKLAEHPYKNALENIRRNISEGVISKKCRTILVFEKDMSFVGEFRTIRSAAKTLNKKEEIITKNLKDITKSNRYIFIYKDSYDSEKDYSYKIFNPKNRKKPKVCPKVSEKCRKSILKPTLIENVNTKEVFYFEKRIDAAKFLNCSESYIKVSLTRNKLIFGTYKVL